MICQGAGICSYRAVNARKYQEVAFLWQFRLGLASSVREQSA